MSTTDVGILLEVTSIIIKKLYYTIGKKSKHESNLLSLRQERYR